MPRLLTLALVIPISLSMAACGKKKIDQLPPPPGGTAAETTTGAPSTIPGSQADFLQQMAGKDVIYFDTDRYNIDSADAEALQRQAQWLLRYPGKRATIEGHCDERGTREYNLALGERRANAAKNYLVSLGVDPSRLSVVSYGKERPVALGSTESAWAQNRRAVTITIE
ncbi:peptidoglycan-associated lipoprotein Pal [Erythrobacter sp. SDW2]|uniref:peptidoglycan-associated lipoprotein Pal n=1 Tax=Erythrobacter sp. SDW2 TaxID=2907154 RepID=UPI001F1D0457|nr:peptidoglycan-associated lipoprotein Pal [Erythrobacter sp. SDW2]UIP06349.1 peptidoglycan-associated lipoprotein Pal [Erythrobacter sp. SDW2]